MTDPGNVKPVSNGPERREWSTKVFLGFLGTISCLYAAILIYHSAKPPDTVAEDDDSVLELCRQLCMQYGLVSSGHIRNDAEAYVKAVQKQKLTEALAVILADTSFSPIPAQQVKLLNQKAVDFDLPNHAGMQQKLSELGHDRPVVIVFYLGYGCSHCVAQLTALDKDLHYFKELDAEVIAISSDPSEHTAERFREYGEFQFPVLSDVDSAVSKTWGVYEPETEEKPELMNHGTFIVDRTGKVIWAEMGKEPFLDNKTLLHVIARSQGLLPSSTPVAQNSGLPQP